MKLARNDNVRIARDDNVRIARNDSVKLARDDNVRIARNDTLSSGLSVSMSFRPSEASGEICKQKYKLTKYKMADFKDGIPIMYQLFCVNFAD